MTALLEAARNAWPFDWPPTEMGVEDGIVWATCPGRVGGVNGYVLIPAEGHAWSAGVPECDDENSWATYESERLLDVHGGITYGASGPWIGFDTMHAWDVWDAEHDPHGTSRIVLDPQHSRHWTPELVADETRNLARQVAAVTR